MCPGRSACATTIWMARSKCEANTRDQESRSRRSASRAQDTPDAAISNSDHAAVAAAHPAASASLAARTRWSGAAPASPNGSVGSAHIAAAHQLQTSSPSHITNDVTSWRSPHTFWDVPPAPPPLPQRAAAQIQEPAAPSVASRWAFQRVLGSEAEIDKLLKALAQRLLDELRSRQAPLDVTFEVSPYSGDASQGVEQATASLGGLAVSGSGSSPPVRGDTGDWDPSAPPACSIHPGFAQSGKVAAADPAPEAPRRSDSSPSASAVAISSSAVRGLEPQHGSRIISLFSVLLDSPLLSFVAGGQ